MAAPHVARHHDVLRGVEPRSGGVIGLASRAMRRALILTAVLTLAGCGGTATRKSPRFVVDTHPQYVVEWGHQERDPPRRT